MPVTCDAGANRRYKVTVLDSLGGFYSIPHAINNHGQVVGHSNIADNSSHHATIWNGTAATDVGVGQSSIAYGINDAGQAVGLTFRDGNFYPISWSGGSATNLETLGGGGAAFGINNSGLIVGTSELAPNTFAYATLWIDGTIADLGTLGGLKRIANGINDAGEIVGYTTIDADGRTEHAAFWKNGSPVDLGGLGPFNSEAKAVNNRGQIVGSSTTAEGHGTRAVLWYRGAITDLGTLGGRFSAATAINNSGQIVGVSTRADNVARPTIWYGTTAVDLSTLVDDSGTGLTLGEPAGINDRGQIALQATMPDRSIRAAVLTPIACDQ